MLYRLVSLRKIIAQAGQVLVPGAKSLNLNAGCYFLDAMHDVLVPCAKFFLRPLDEWD